MSSGAQAQMLPCGRRLHLHHGPIDLIIEATGPQAAVCYASATRRFETVLAGLAAELPALRSPLRAGSKFNDPVARRMQQAVAPHCGVFVTPMAAVAGAVADAVLAAMVTAHAPAKAYVNNGGDVAFHLTQDHRMQAAGPAGPICISAEDPVRGLATSGWRGRSHSLGIADAVTVAAKNAAAADVAATLIANAVDLPGHPSIARLPAHDLSPDSDLGARAVTTQVGALSTAEVETALSRGRAVAQDLCAQGLIHQAVLRLRGQTTHTAAQTIGNPTYA